MDYTIAIKNDIFKVTAYEQASPKGFIAFLDDLDNNEAWTPGSKLLVDLRKLEGFDTKQMDFPAISSIASFIKKHSDKFMNMKVVTLLTGDMDGQVVTGLWESLQNYYGSEFEHKVFTSYEAAINWLKSN